MSSQELVTSLTPQLCCATFDDNCTESDFCTTLRKNPQALNFQNSGQFCDWFERSGCADLLENPQTSISEFSIHQQCSGMTAGDLSKARTFCAGVRSASQSVPPATPPPQPPGGDPGINWLGDGAIATAIATAILYAKRFLNVMKEIGQKAAEAGENLGAPTRMLRAINKELLSLLKETRKFFGETLVEWGKFVEDLITLRIFTKKKSKTEKKAPAQDETPRRLQTGQYLRPVTAPHHPIVGEPRRSVVLEQIRGLLERDTKYDAQKEVFEQLGKVGQLNLAKLAIDNWNHLWQLGTDEEQAEIGELADRDRSPYGGKLPFRYLQKKVIERYLRASMIDAFKASALEALAGEIAPVQENVERQVLANTRFWAQVDGLSSGKDARYADRYEIVKYLAPRLIHRWGQLGLTQKAGTMDINEFPKEGDLPALYVGGALDEIVSGNNFQHIISIAPFFAQILAFKPELQSYGFEMINRRAERLLSAWESAVDYIVDIFGEPDVQGHVNQAVVALMRSSLDIGVTQRERPEPASEPWRFDPTETKLIEGVNLSRVMKLLVQENPQLAYYPEILERRARAAIEDWFGMNPVFRDGFTAKDLRDGYAVDESEPSINFAKFWYRINGEIGVSDRPSINPGEGPGRGGRNNGSPAAQGGGSTVTGTFEPNEVSSGAQGARRTVEIPLVRSAYVARARQRAIVSGGFLCRQPASSSANILRNLFTVQRPAFATVR